MKSWPSLKSNSNCSSSINGTRSSAIALFICLLFQISTVHAMPSYARLFKHQYGYTPSCQGCHTEGGGTPLNLYGKEFEKQGKTLAALELMAQLDSDQDGFSNAEESKNKSNPGDKGSTPSSAGEWLSLSNFIPKEVQNLFKQAEAWKPLDAILTESDLSRAEALGVKLSPEDENTIYIPVVNRRPVGTALIFPVKHQSETHLFILATDRQLNITHVIPLKSDMESKSNDLDINGDVLESFVGEALQSVKTNETNATSKQLSSAVKRAGMLVYVRLKGA